MEAQTQTSLDERVSYHESPAYSVAKGLRENGYEIANSSGLMQTEPNHDVIGILKGREPVQKSFSGLKWNKSQRAFYLGTLWLNNQARNAKEDKNWVLEVYGREYVSELTKLVKNLSEPNEVKVQVRLESEIPRVEVYDSDYGDLGI